MEYISKAGLIERLEKDISYITLALNDVIPTSYKERLSERLGQIREDLALIKASPAADVVPREDYRTDHGYIWLCPECGLPVHSDYDECPRCGPKKDETWRK